MYKNTQKNNRKIRRGENAKRETKKSHVCVCYNVRKKVVVGGEREKEREGGRETNCYS